MCGLIRIDGRTFQYAGSLRSIENIPQTSVSVYPTRTVYTFETDGVQLQLTFLTPALPNNLDILSRPVTYICFDVTATDMKRHDVQVYMDFGSEICVNNYNDLTTDARFRLKNMDLMAFTAARPNLLSRAGDDLRIDWGYFYIGLPTQTPFSSALYPRDPMRGCFKTDGTVPDQDRLEAANPYRRTRDIAAGVVKAITVSPDASDSFHLLVAYDDSFSIEFLYQKLAAYWRRNGLRFADMMTAAENDFESLKQQCIAFDDKLLHDAAAIGGQDYAALCAISFRQAIAAHKLVTAADGTPLFFSKENFSNGCICTVDVTYPSAPLFLLTQPVLLKGMLIPILQYAALRRWPFAFAPHDLGTYPLANGQVYGGGEQTEDCQMPIEECGNMLILAGALVCFDHDVDFAAMYWPTLSQWADYLLDKGYDPENQLCTDDFAGHLAHNANLSIKAIMAIGAYAKMAEALGKTDVADRFMTAARNAASRWEADASDENGAFRLAFDQPGSWSQKYNLVWDKLLKLNIFHDDVAKREMALYKRRLQTFGLPLDSRKTYTKLDWILWSATLTQNDDDFKTLLAPVIRFMNETEDRVPLSDWYETVNAKKVGFQARSVVGGVFLAMLYDEQLRASYR